MPLNVRGYAAHSATAPLQLFDFARRAPRANDVVIKILYCGVCHSDLHSARNDWGNSVYPLVPGHEIVGRVTQVGGAVSRFAVGDTVGVGCMVDSCQRCRACTRGLEQYCENGATLTYNSTDPHDGLPTYGGYAEQIVVSEKFVIKISAALALPGAAPLLCAGITTWSPLKHWNVGSASQVAVMGLGGLGHMALKLANALGAEVTLLTRTADKEQDARRLGADHIVLTSDAAQMQRVAGRFDVIIDTVPYAHDLNPAVNTLATDGTLVLVGYLGPLEPLVHSVPLVTGRKAVAGSAIGGIAQTQELLDFCAQHGITADIEMIQMQDINQAYTRMLRSDVKYRFVIDMTSLAATKA